MLAEKYLADLGITIQQANDFINTNLGEPQKIFEAASQYGVTTRMLGEITGYSRDIVNQYFPNPDMGKLLDKCKLVNSDLGSLESLVAFNTREGILSNASLRAIVKPQIDSVYVYDLTFRSSNPELQLKDDLYSSGELGVENLNNVPAPTIDNIESIVNIESIFYGTLINMLSTLDQAELNQINTFPRNDNPDEFQLLISNLLTESPTPIAWNDEQLADLVTTEAVNIIAKYWTNDLFGILDHSYLGLATT